MVRSGRFGLPRSVWGVFALALLVRGSFVAYHAAQGWHLRHDPGMYLTLAMNLRHGVFSMFHPLDIPDTIKMPGYPLLIHLLGGHIAAVLALQVVLSAAKGPLTYLLARRLGIGAPWAVGAAALLAMEPMDVLLAGQVLTESVFGTFVLAGILLATGQGVRFVLPAALLLAAAAWVRPNGIWLIVLAGVVPIAIHRSWSHALVLCSSGLVLVLPWAVRNLAVLDRFYLGDSAVVAAAYYQVPDVLRTASDARSIHWSQELEQRAAATDWEDRSAFHTFFDALRTEVRSTFSQYPFTWARTQLWKAMRILVAPGRGHIHRFFPSAPTAQNVLLAWSLAYSVVLLAACAVLLLRWGSAPLLLWVLILLCAYLIFSGALTTSDARFKNPAMPFLLLVVAWAGEQALGQRTHKGSPIP